MEDLLNLIKSSKTSTELKKNLKDNHYSFESKNFNDCIVIEVYKMCVIVLTDECANVINL